MSENQFQSQKLINATSIRQNLDLKKVINRVREALMSYARGNAQMPAKNYITFPEFSGDVRTMSAFVPEFELATVKIVNAHPENPSQHQLPSVMALLIALDPETGMPVSVMDATEITAFRTAAASAIATDRLADPDASVLGLIGAGAQAYRQIQGQCTIRPIERVIIADPKLANAQTVAGKLRTDGIIEQVETTTDPGSFPRKCDVIISVTPSKSPVISSIDTIADSLHVNAIGADAPGKKEWPSEFVQSCRIIVDDWEQAKHSGEINTLVEAGKVTKNQIYGSLGDALVSSDEPIPSPTLFDSTGLAIQDNAAAKVVLDSTINATTTFNFLQ